MEMLGQRPIRVLHIFGSLDKGGAESRIMDIYRKIDRSKVQFDFVILGVRREGLESYFYYNEIISLGGRVFGVKSWHEIGMVEYLRHWKEILCMESYQTVHSHGSVWSGCDLFPAWINGVPNRIAHARDSGLVPNVSRKQRISYWVMRWLTAAFANEKIYCSCEAADFSFGKNKYGGSNSHFLPNAIDLSRFYILTDEKRSILKKEIGLDGAECIVGTVGNAKPVKNHIFLVKAFHRFLSYRDHAKLMIVGNDEEDGEAKEYVATNGLGDAVVFTGLRNDVPELLQLMDVFILPSFKEGAPGAAIEAQASNVPCILSDSITRDVDVGTGLVKYISLDEPLDVWAEEMLKDCTGARPAREETIQKLRDAGYDVESSCKKLLEIYKIA